MLVYLRNLLVIELLNATCEDIYIYIYSKECIFLINTFERKISRVLIFRKLFIINEHRVESESSIRLRVALDSVKNILERNCFLGFFFFFFKYRIASKKYVFQLANSKVRNRFTQKWLLFKLSFNSFDTLSFSNINREERKF